MRRRSWIPAVAAAAAVALGVFADYGHHLPLPAGYLPQLGAPWLALSFVVGYHSITWRRAVLAGTGALMLGLASYLAFKVSAYGAYSVGAFRSEWRFWLSAAAVLGTAMGVAGFLGRSGSANMRAAGWASLAAVFITEGVAVALGPFHAPPSIGFVEVLVGACIAVTGARFCTPVKAATATLLLTAAGLITAVSVGSVFRGIV